MENRLYRPITCFFYVVGAIILTISAFLFILSSDYANFGGQYTFLAVFCLVWGMIMVLFGLFIHLEYHHFRNIGISTRKFEGYVNITGENIVGTEETHDDIEFDKEIETYDWLSDTINEHIGKKISIEIKIKEL